MCYPPAVIDVLLIERLVADALERAWPAATHRRIRLPALPGKADAVIGPRRAGKTWLLYAHAAALQAGPSAVAREQVLYLNFEDERLAGLGADELHLFIDAWHRRCPAVLEHERTLLLDEIQVVPGWERFVRRLLDEQGNRVVVTGSSARLLSREIATALRGRALTTEVLPFSFAEALTHGGIAIPARWPAPGTVAPVLRHALDRYLQTGGFPEVQSLDADLRARVLRDYVDVALLRDVIERHGVTNIPGLRSLSRRLLAAPAGKFSVHRFHNDLRSAGLPVSKDSLHDWLGYLEDACFVFFVPIYTQSEAVRRANPRKAYPVDPALTPGSGDVGHRLETVVYLELRRRGFEIAWLSNADGTDVDFIATDRDANSTLVQVSADIRDPATRAREVGALATAMRERNLHEGMILTLGGAETLQVPEGKIHVRQAWEWLASGGE